MTILDTSSDDIQQQGAPAQADDADEESVQSGEVLDQGQIRPNRKKARSVKNVRVISITDDQDHCDVDRVCHCPEY